MGNKEDVCNFAQFVNDKIRHVYIEHGITNLFTYFMSLDGPRKIIIEDISEARDMNEPSLSNTVQMPERETYHVLIVENGEVDLGDVNSKSIIVSPEYNRKRVWKHDKSISSCSRKLNIDIHIIDDRVINDMDKGKDTIEHIPTMDLMIGANYDDGANIENVPTMNHVTD